MDFNDYIKQVKTTLNQVYARHAFPNKNAHQALDAMAKKHHQTEMLLKQWYNRCAGMIEARGPEDDKLIDKTKKLLSL